MRVTETSTGFKWGSAVVSRVCDDDDKGWVTVCVESPQGKIFVTVRKSGAFIIREVMEGDRPISHQLPTPR
jgi:hypothetical protein